ncbi:hypothetical protein ACI65C_012913 [Semiaphis heraclei]
MRSSLKTINRDGRTLAVRTPSPFVQIYSFVIRMKTPRAIPIWLAKICYLRGRLAMISDPPKTRDWWPALEDFRLTDTAVIVLNTSIENPPKLVRHLWNKSWLRVTVDGGTNKWHNFVKQNSFDDLKYPDLITGDLDSANPAVVEQFVSMGSKIIPTPNQDETDFTKALKEVKKHSAKNRKSIDSIIVMVNMCHRVDHFLSNLNTLYKSKTKDLYYDEDIYLLGRNSLTWLLQAGTHRIHVPQSLRLNPENNYLGIFPMGSACNECTTTGLKWNLSGKLMEMGGLTSSSNTFNGEPIVTIANSSPLLWTMTMGYEDSF